MALAHKHLTGRGQQLFLEDFVRQYYALQKKIRKSQPWKFYEKVWVNTSLIFFCISPFKIQFTSEPVPTNWVHVTGRTWKQIWLVVFPQTCPLPPQLPQHSPVIHHKNIPTSQAPLGWGCPTAATLHQWLLFQIRELVANSPQAALFWLVYVRETRLNRPSYFQN